VTLFYVNTRGLDIFRIARHRCIELDDSFLIGYDAVSVGSYSFYTLEDDGTIFLHKVTNLVPSDAASYPRRMESQPHQYRNLKTHM
jgi:hypothetical protein